MTNGENPELYVLIPAAGLGSRMGQSDNKVFLKLDGQPMLAHTLRPFIGLAGLRSVQLVGRSNEELERLTRLAAEVGLDCALLPVLGGETRQDSVLAGLEALAGQGAEDRAIVLIHDAARCLVSPELIRDCVAATCRYGATIAAVPVKDTIKRVTAEGLVTETLARETLWRAQTPQAFYFGEILAAHRQAKALGLRATDDAQVAEAYGINVHVVSSSDRNLKITTPDDLAIASYYLAKGRP